MNSLSALHLSTTPPYVIIDLDPADDDLLYKIAKVVEVARKRGGYIHLEVTKVEPDGN